MNQESSSIDWATINWRPRFFTIWSAQAISLIGSALTQFVLIWWITDTTGSAGALAMAGIMGMLPQALFGPLGGTLADRWSRRLMMIVTDAVTALCMVVLIVLFATEYVQLWHIYVLMFIRSTMQAFQGPASAASTSMLVPPDWLTRAAGMNQTVQGLMGIASAPLGALALGVFSLQGALMIDVVTALIGIAPLLFYRIPQYARTDTAESSVWQDLRLGLRLLLQHAGIRWLYGLTVLMVAVLMPALTVLPLLVRNEFGGGVNEVAVIEGIGGVGMLIGGVLITVLTFPIRRVLVVLISFIVSCGLIALMGLTPANLFWVVVVLWFFSSVAFAMGNAPIIALLQTIVPNHLQGRALSVFSALIGLAGPIGLMIAAPLGDVIGTRGLLVAGGTLSVAVCVYGLFTPSLIRIEEHHVSSE